MEKKNKKFRSDIAQAVHEGVSDLHRLGLVGPRTLRDFDARCFTPIEELSAADIQRLRHREGVSQAVLARSLNLTTGQISQLERGVKRARGATLKLLCLVEKNGLEAVL